ncbi:MAG: type II toxin-antitoxin system VapC family toxin [Bacteroidia bacterium]
MYTVTIDIINHKVLKLLQDLELLQLIRLRKDKAPHEGQNINWQKYKGAMSKQSLNEVDQQLNELRNMGVRYLWDTNTAIYYLQQLFPPSAETFIDNILAESQPVISAITEIELLCWRNASEQDMAVLQNFINDVWVVELEQAVKLKTAEIRKAHRIKLPDAIIAATALVHDLTLITRNVSDFNGIEGLVVINPFEES